MNEDEIDGLRRGRGKRYIDTRKVREGTMSMLDYGKNGIMKTNENKIDSLRGIYYVER